MNVIGIESSCDETGVGIVRWRDDPTNDAAYGALEGLYLEPCRYVVQPGAERFRVVDMWTGETVVIALTPQNNLCEADAAQMPEMLRRRSGRGDRSIRQ